MQIYEHLLFLVLTYFLLTIQTGDARKEPTKANQKGTHNRIFYQSSWLAASSGRFIREYINRPGI